MLRSLQDLDHYKINATDGEIGHVSDFYFDDDTWVIRYVVVDAGSWLSSRKVLISPISVKQLDTQAQTLSVILNKAQVRHSPNIDADKPVSRQNEATYMGYYGYQPYWVGTGVWGDGLHPHAAAAASDRGEGDDRVECAQRELAAYLRDDLAHHRSDDPHLRSFHAITGYRIHATDGEVGHVTGFLVDEETWAIRYLVIDTSNWWIGHKALIAPAWIQGVRWTDRSVTVDLSRKLIQNAPPYVSAKEWGREQDADLYAHYGRGGYWAG